MTLLRRRVAPLLVLALLLAEVSVSYVRAVAPGEDTPRLPNGDMAATYVVR